MGADSEHRTRSGQPRANSYIYQLSMKTSLRLRTETLWSVTMSCHSATGFLIKTLGGLSSTWKGPVIRIPIVSIDGRSIRTHRLQRLSRPPHARKVGKFVKL